MTNYENDTLDLLPGDSPKQKYEYLLEMFNMLTGLSGEVKLHPHERETIKNFLNEAKLK